MTSLFARVEVGIDRLFEPQFCKILEGKRIGLVTNQTGVDHQLRSSIDLIKEHAGSYALVALFSPEHGIRGAIQAEGWVDNEVDGESLPIYSLHGETRRPTEEMLKGIDLILYDIQDVGVRPYTYSSTLYYVMEEAAKRNIEVVVLDRPNPINGVTVDGPLLDPEWRSFIGYIDIPFVHGLTIGEMARFFNGEYEIGCRLTVIPLKGWHRKMSYKETGLLWVPTSPHIPEPDTPLYYASTNILGELLSIVSIGVGTTQPFKIVGAPWMDGGRLAALLSKQNLPGVLFHPFSFTPFFGRFEKQECSGIRIVITDPAKYRPVTTQFFIMGMIKTLHPIQFGEGCELTAERRSFLLKAAGSEEFLRIVKAEQYIAWPLAQLHENRRDRYLKIREKYLLYH
jgi:uncharacterized protein YbbC (DUF1343 family)